MLYFIWLYFSRRTTQPGYAGTTMNLQIILNTQKNPYLNQATGKNTCPIFLPPKNPRIENSKPQKILRSSPFPRELSISNLLQEQCQEIYQNSNSGNRHQTPDFFHKLTSKPPSSNTCYIFQTTIEMENVVDCQLMDEKSNGKSLFRVIYFSHNARDFKHYDFEAESDMSGKCCRAFLG